MILVWAVFLVLLVTYKYRQQITYGLHYIRWSTLSCLQYEEHTHTSSSSSLSVSVLSPVEVEAEYVVTLHTVMRKTNLGPPPKYEPPPEYDEAVCMSPPPVYVLGHSVLV